MRAVFARPLLVAASLAVAVRPATAASGPADEPLEEVLVTASLHRERASELAASLSTLDAATIREAGVQHLQDLLPLVPNLNWASGTSRPRYYQLRGIGETDQWQGAPNPSVGFLIDGMDFSGLGMPATLLDLQQVQVLRGPQGTIHGANALAGLIDLRTQPAQPQPLARIELGGADFGTSSFGGVAGGALCAGCEGAWRLVAQRHRSDGFMHNVFLHRDDTNGYDESTLRGRLALEPAPDLRLDVSALWVDDDNGYDAFTLDNSRNSRADKPGRDAQRSRGVSLGLDWAAPGAFVLRSVSAWTDADVHYSFDGDWGADPAYDYTSRFLRTHRNWSEDLRLVSKSDASAPGSGAWVLGAYWLDVSEGNDQLDLYNGDVFRAITSDYGASSGALYGQYRWHFAAAWSAVLGLRLEQRTARYRDTDGGDFHPRDRMAGGNASLEYALGAGRNLYLTLARGYKAGGFNIGAVVPPERRLFAPEYLQSVELGWHQAAPGARGSLRAALFYMRRTDQQVSTSVQVDPGDPLSFIYLTDNAARGENYGLELEATWRASERLRVDAGVGLLRTRYLGYSIGSRSLDGRDQAHAPREQLTLSAEYRDPRGFYLRADAQHVAAFYFSESHDQRSRPYQLVNLRAGYDAERWGVSLWARNAFDAQYAQRGFFFGNEPPDFPDKLYIQPADPRQVGASLWVQLR